MGKLIYQSTASLDSYIEDPEGKSDWAFPGEEVHIFINDLIRTSGIHLYGRRMYQIMMGWETDPSYAGDSPVTRDFAEIWKAADKIVYSHTLDKVSTTRTRIENNFDPETVQKLKESTRQELLIGGPTLAQYAFEAGLVDEVRLFLVPIIIGGGKPALPKNVHLPLELVDERKFDNGITYVHYRTR
jgi:dihydrofolate reductase